MTNVPAGLSMVLRLDTSGTHHLALQADGTPIAWGGNAYGETSIPAGLANVADVAAGDGFSVALAGAGAPYVGPPLPRRATPYGMTAWLRCVAVGEPPMSYQWRFNGEDLPGANDLLLTLPAVTFADEGRYSVVVSNGLGRATNTVELAVPPLLIVEQPRSQQLLPGATATFRVTANSALPLSYQWTLNGLALPGATNSSLLLTQVQPDAAGEYEVEVRNVLGSVRSVTATLSLTLVMAWGTNTLGQLEVPAGLHDAVALGSGDAHGLAVKADGTVVAWGDDRYGQTRIPVDLTNAIAVAGGAWHSVALRADGRVTAWGDNRYGQTNVPPFLDQVVAVAAGSFHSLALRADGTVVGWGDNRFGKANPPAFLSGVVAIAAGSGSSLALRSDGTIVTWTTSEAVIPAPGAGGPRWTNLPPTQAVAISSRGSQHVAIRPDGTAQVWGSFGYGGAVAAPAELSNLVAVAAGTGHFLALQEDGMPATWGARTSTGGWLPSPQSILQLPEGLTHIAAIAAGSDHSLALGGAGPPVMTSLLPHCAVVPCRTAYLHAAATGGQPLSYQWRFNGIQIVGATRATLALTNVQPDQAGDYSVVVSNPLGSITNTGTRVEVIPAFLTALSPDQSTFQGGTARFQVAATGPGPLSYQWQFDGTDLAGATDSVLQLDHVQAHQAGSYSVKIGNAHGTLSSPAVRLRVGQVVAWGDNAMGRTNVPAGLTGVTRIFQTYRQVLALKADGTLVTWGGSAVVPAGLDRVVEVAAGVAHYVALREDGTLVAWGDNYAGETDVPPGLAGVTAIAVRDAVNFAVTAAGGVVVWGDLYHELAGVPQGLGQVEAISIGSRHALALMADGTVAAWGNNEWGQIEVPIRLAGVVKVLAAGDLSLALRKDGTLVAWGDNADGQGVVPPNLGEVVSMASSGRHVLALTRGGRVVAWGENSCGQSDVPAELGGVRSVIADGCTSLALQSGGKVVGWGQALAGQSALLPRLENVSAITAFDGYAVARLGDGPPSASLPLRDAAWNAGEFTFRFTPSRGSVYSVEYTDSPDLVRWTALPLVRSGGVELRWTDSAARGPLRFYRVREW
jgi:alpha-tubulin suppressor-like RCC1 family protein